VPCRACAVDNALINRMFGIGHDCVSPSLLYCLPHYHYLTSQYRRSFASAVWVGSEPGISSASILVTASAVIGWPNRYPWALFLAALQTQQDGLGLGLHALGDCTHTHGLGQRQDGSNDGGSAEFADQATNEAAVDFVEANFCRYPRLE